jgi:hypothetical protein
VLRGGRTQVARVTEEDDERRELDDRNQLPDTDRELAVMRERRPLGAFRAREAGATLRSHVFVEAERDQVGTRDQNEQERAQRDEE